MKCNCASFGDDSLLLLLFPDNDYDLKVLHEINAMVNDLDEEEEEK